MLERKVPSYNLTLLNLAVAPNPGVPGETYSKGETTSTGDENEYDTLSLIALKTVPALIVIDIGALPLSPENVEKTLKSNNELEDLADLGNYPRLLA